MVWDLPAGADRSSRYSIDVQPEVGEIHLDRPILLPNAISICCSQDSYDLPEYLTRRLGGVDVGKLAEHVDVFHAPNRDMTAVTPDQHRVDSPLLQSRIGLEHAAYLCVGRGRVCDVIVWGFDVRACAFEVASQQGHWSSWSATAPLTDDCCPVYDGGVTDRT